MYKININNNILLLVQSDNLEDSALTKGTLIAPYAGKTKFLLSYIDMLEKTNKYNRIIIHHNDIKLLKKDFKSLFKIIKASGGVVKNENEQILFIFRRGHWDLPKGKIEKGEKKRQAAIREVEEETGIANISLGEKIMTTYHTYRIKDDRRAIKKTYWYQMSALKQPLIPQVNEDIEKAVWAKSEDIINDDLPIYQNILDVLNQSKV